MHYLVADIAYVLGERDPSARRYIARMLDVLGEQPTLQLVETAKAVHGGEGMQYTTADGTAQQRTLGGCFFKLAKITLGKEKRSAVFSPGHAERKRQEKLRRMSWPRLGELLGSSEARGVEAGTLVASRLTVEGRPKEVLLPPGGEAVVVLMEDRETPPLPVGSPRPPTPLQFAVYVGSRQWRKVSGKLKDRRDAFIFEGFAVFNSGFNGVTLLAQTTSTKRLKAEQQARARQARQKQGSASGAGEDPASRAEPEPQTEPVKPESKESRTAPTRRIKAGSERGQLPG